MKKKAMVLISFLAIMSFNACSKAADGVKAPPAITNPDNGGGTGDTGGNTADTAYFYSSTGEIGIESTWGEWGTGTNIDTTAIDASYTKVIKLTGGSSWGTVLAFPGLTEGLFEGYTNLEFKVKSSDFTEIIVKLAKGEPVGAEKKYLLSSGTALSNGWVQMIIPLSDFSAVTSMANEFAIFNNTQHVAGKTMFLADIKLTGKKSTGGDTGGTDGDTGGTSGDDPYSATIGATGISSMDAWGSGSTIVNKNTTIDAHPNTIEVAAGSGWKGETNVNAYAGVLAFNGLQAGALSGKSELTVTFKANNTSSDTTESIEIQMPGGGTAVTAYSTGVNCKSWITTNGWHTVTINMADFSNVATVTDIVFIIKDDTAQNMYFTNIALN